MRSGLYTCTNQIKVAYGVYDYMLTDESTGVSFHVTEQEPNEIEDRLVVGKKYSISVIHEAKA